MRNLTPTQFSTLVRIDLVGECSQNKLGRMISMDVATIKGVVDRLKKKDLVNIQPDPNDRRRTIISLTDESKELVSDLHEMGAYITDATLEPLTEKEKKTLLRLLKKIT
ncbi:MAG: MarR family transcriptional regulator [Amylibacter sp.]|nr:MarR family transcriptional regulator [Amylibacter sp.]